MIITNPATEEQFFELPDDSPESIEAKFESARYGQHVWKKRSLEQRCEIIKEFREMLFDSAQPLGELLSQEMGKPVSQAVGEIQGACQRIDYFLAEVGNVIGDDQKLKDGERSEFVSHEPLGVIANISAWNYPYLVGVNVFVPALLCGNAVLYKPSEHATLTGLKIQDLLQDAGVPFDIFQTVMGGAEAGEVLLDLPLNGYFFTGSYRTGQYIYKNVAPKMVRCQMELGGKDPVYVSEHNSKIGEVANALADGAFYNNGQSCCAVERIYVHASQYEEFVSEFVKAVSQFKVGDPSVDGTYIGPLARKEQITVLQDQVKDAKSKGGQVLLGGEEIEGKGWFFNPTVIKDCDHTMDVMNEESFGPIIGIQSVESKDSAVKLMRDTEYGLTSSIYSDDEEEAMWLLKKMDSGTVYWNCCDRVSPRMPWSGRQHSGIGATLGYEGIRAFVQTKSFNLNGRL